MSTISRRIRYDIIIIQNTIKENHYDYDIRRALPNINSRTLSTRLKEFEENRIVTRTVSDTQPIRVSYELTDLGKGVYELLVPLLIFFASEKYELDQ